jgi:long-chain fatty acid transport protein
VRAIVSSNRYLGYFKDAQLMVNNELVPASEWLTTTALPAASNHRSSALSDVTKCQQLISAGAGAYTIAQVQTAGYISSAERARLENDLRNYAGLTSAQIAALNINQAYTRFNSAYLSFNSATVKIPEAANIMDDKESDAEQRGSGLTPVLAMNVNLGKSFNMSMRYEFRTSLTMTNNIISNDFELYPGEAESAYEIPALLAIGAGYRLQELIEVQVSFNLWLDKHINWGRNLRDYLTAASEEDIRDRELEANTWELALGLQYNVNSKIAVSLGCLTSQPAPEDSFQNDFGYTSPSVTAGGGIQWKLTESLTLDAGIMNAFYRDVNITYTDAKLQEWFTKYPELYGGSEYSDGEFSEIYKKSRLGISLGLSYNILK